MGIIDGKPTPLFPVVDEDPWDFLSLEDEANSSESPLDLSFLTPEKIDVSNAISRDEGLLEGGAVDPARAARILQLELQTGLPGPMIRENFKEIDESQKRADFDPQRFREKSPVVAKWMASNPQFYNLARNDLDQMYALEAIQTSIDKGFTYGRKQTKLGRLGSRALAGDITIHDKRIISLESDLSNKPGGDSFAATYVFSAAKILGQFYETGKYAAPLVAQGAIVGAFIGSTAGGVGALPGMLSVGGMAARAAIAFDMYRIESGLAYLELTKIRGRNGEALDPNAIAAVAHTVGIVNAALEMVGLHLVSYPWRKASSLFLRRASREVLIRPTMLRAATEAAKSYLVGVGGEISTEATQEAMNILGEELAKMFSSGDFETLMKDPREREKAWIRMGQIIKETFQGMVLLGVPGASVQAGVGFAESQRIDRKLSFYSELGKVASSTETYKNAPDAQSVLMAMLAEGGPMETASIPADLWETYWQERGEDPAQAALELLGENETYVDALRAGHEFSVPWERYVGKISTTEHGAYFDEHIRGNGELSSLSDARQVLEGQQQAAEATFQLVKDNQETLDRLEKMITDQLVDTGTDAEVAQIQATIITRAMTSNIIRSRRDLTAELAKFEVSFVRQGLDIVKGQDRDKFFNTVFDRIRQEDLAAKTEAGAAIAAGTIQADETVQGVDFFGEEQEAEEVVIPDDESPEDKAVRIGKEELLSRGIDIQTMNNEDIIALFELTPRKGETLGGETVMRQEADGEVRRVGAGGTIPPARPEPTAEEIARAASETSGGQMNVRERLNAVIPEKDRVPGSPNGVYVVGHPDGRPWTDMSKDELAEEGPGYGGGKEVFDAIWAKVMENATPAAKQAVEDTGAHFNMSADSIDAAMKLPLRAQLWYELSGGKFAEELAQLTDKQMMVFADLIGATSNRTPPNMNLKRALGVISQWLQGRKIDLDLATPDAVEDALRRDGENVSSLEGNKTGMFSNTIALVMGLITEYPIPVNDVWIADVFGVTDVQLGGNQALHEVMAKFQIELTKYINDENKGAAIPHQPWMIQARIWVQRRIEQKKATSGNDYAQEWDDVINDLNEAKIPGVNGDAITREALMHPDFVLALRKTLEAFRDAPKATVEGGTVRTKVGRRTKVLMDLAEEAGLTDILDDHMNVLVQGLKRSGQRTLEPKKDKDGNEVKDKDGKVVKVKKPTLYERVIRAVTGLPLKLTRISYGKSEGMADVAGTYQGVLSPNVKVPMWGERSVKGESIRQILTDEEIQHFNAIVGKAFDQEDMAVSHVLYNDGSVIPAGYIKNVAIRLDDDSIDGKTFQAFADALPKEHEILIDREPGGYTVDITPRFVDGQDLPDAISEADLDRAVAAVFPHAKIMFTAYKSTAFDNRKKYDTIKMKELRKIENAAIEKLVKMGVSKDDAKTILNSEEWPGHGLQRDYGKSLRKRIETVAGAFRKRTDSIDQSQEVANEFARQLRGEMHRKNQEWASALVKAGVKVPRDRNQNIDPVTFNQNFQELVNASPDSFSSPLPFTAAELAAMDSDEFNEWFKGSKINEGEVNGVAIPAIMFHGSAEDITSFDTPTFFAQDADFAASYARDRGRGDGDVIYPVYLSIKNPAQEEDVIAAALSIPEIADEARGLHEQGLSGYIFLSYGFMDSKSGEHLRGKVMAKLKERGFDGAEFYNDYAMDDSLREIYSVVAFDPEQVKSLFSEGFRPDSEVILEQRAFQGTPAEPFQYYDSAFNRTGEGTNYRGAGHYFASLLDVGEYYRKRLAGKISNFLDGKEVRPQGLGIVLPRHRQGSRPVSQRFEELGKEEQERRVFSFMLFEAQRNEWKDRHEGGDVTESSRLSAEMEIDGILTARLEELGRIQEFESGDMTDVGMVSDTFQQALRTDRQDIKDKTWWRRGGRETVVSDSVIKGSIQRAITIAKDSLSDRIDELNAFKKAIKEADLNRIEQKEPGHIVTVEIPESDQFLHLEESLANQPAPVKEAIAKIPDEIWAGVESAYLGFFDAEGTLHREDRDVSGWELYRALETYASESTLMPENDDGSMSFARETSNYLLSLGIQGNVFPDQFTRRGKVEPGKESDIFVVFDDRAIDIITFEQEQKKGVPAATITFDPRQRGAEHRRLTIELLPAANLSSVFHEGFHLSLEMMVDLVGRIEAETIGGPGQQVVDDLNTLFKWFGITKASEITEDHHEMFARAGEQYLREGKAPSEDLRGVFARVRAWFMFVYRLAKIPYGDRLNDDVREVFDRMLATDDEIDAAGRAAEVEQIFTTAEDAGMTEQKFALYEADIQKAREKAIEEVTRKIHAEREREKKAWWKEERERVRAEVSAQVNTQPVYQALSILQSGKTPDGEEDVSGLGGAKLDLTELEEIYGKESSLVAAMKELRVARRKGGVASDIAAERLEFGSGDELVKALAEVRERTASKLIETETDFRMRQMHGDMMLDGGLAVAAEEAILNEGREKVVEAEIRALRALERKVKPHVREAERADREGARRGLAGIVTLRVARSLAQGRLARTMVRDVKPNTFLVAARRASRLAFKLAAQKKYDEAAGQKNIEIVNIALYRESLKQIAQVDKYIKFLRSFKSKSVRAKLNKAGADYLDQIDAILERFDISPMTIAALDRKQGLREWVEAKQAEGLPVELPENLLNDAFRQNFKEMTLEELQGVRDAVKHIAHMAAFKNKLLRQKEQRDLEEARDTVAGTILNNAAKFLPVKLETSRPEDSRMNAYGAGVAAHRKLNSYIREFDGFEDGGEVWDLVMRPLNEAADLETEMKADATRRLSEIFSVYTDADLSTMYRQELQTTLGTTLSKQGKLMMALNWGNIDNREKLLSGLGTTLGREVSEADVQVILDSLDERDWNFAQNMWDFFESYWPAMKELAEDIDGIAPEKIEATEVETQFGTFRGGYFPIVYDFKQDQKTADFKMQDEVKRTMNGSSARASTKAGARHDRVGNSGRAMLLDFGIINRGIENVIHDISHTRTLIDVVRILRGKQVESAIRTTKGDIVLKTILSALDDIAGGTAKNLNGFEQSFQWVRAGTSIAFLGWSATTMLLQPLGLAPSFTRVGAKYMIKAIAQWAASSSSMENGTAWVHEKSSFMKHRHQTMNLEINEIMNKVKPLAGIEAANLAAKLGAPDGTLEYAIKLGRALGVAADSAFWGIAKMQMVADMPTWLGAYWEAMDGGIDESKAIAMADQIVIATQGSGHIKDLAGVQRGSEFFRIWTSFYSFFSSQYQLLAETNNELKLRGAKHIGRAAVSFLMIVTVPTLLETAMREVVTGKDDDDEGVTEKIIRAHGSFLFGMMLGLRELSGILAGFHGYTGPAGARIFSEMTKLFVQISQGEFDEPLTRNLNRVGGILLHYPANQADRTVRGLKALLDGKTKNPFAIFFGPPRK